MDTLTKRQKLHDHINVADDEKVEEIYTAYLGDENKPYEWWNDKEMVADLEQISADMKSGKDKGIPWEELREQLLNRANRK